MLLVSPGTNVSFAYRLDDAHTAQMDIDPDGFVGNAADKLGVLSHRVRAGMKKFEHFIEERGADTGGWSGDVDHPTP